MSLAKAILHSIVYIIVNTFFGLAPLWIIFQSSLYNFTVSSHELIKEGIIMYFCIAIIGSISYDYNLADITRNRIIRYLSLALPFVMLSAVSISFMGLSYDSNELFDFSRLIILQWILVVITIAYCLIFKTILFCSEKNSNR